MVLLKSPANTTHPDHFPPSPEQCVFLPFEICPYNHRRGSFFSLSEEQHEKCFLYLGSRGWSETSGFPPPSEPLCVCVAAAPAAQGLVPTQLCLQSSVFLQEAAHLPLPPLASCELLTSFPLLPFQGSRERFLLLLGYRHQCGYNPLFPFVPRPFGAVCSFLPLIPSILSAPFRTESAFSA